MRQYIQRIILTLAVGVLLWACGDTDSGGTSDPCASEEYKRDHYVECASEEERDQASDDAQAEARRRNDSAQNPEDGELVACSFGCPPDMESCSDVVHACNYSDRMTDTITCVWRVQYWTGEGYSDTPNADGTDEVKRAPKVLCDCEHTLDEGDAICAG